VLRIEPVFLLRAPIAGAWPFSDLTDNRWGFLTAGEENINGGTGDEGAVGFGERACARGAGRLKSLHRCNNHTALARNPGFARRGDLAAG
jgi:hypothetical protein